MGNIISEQTRSAKIAGITITVILISVLIIIIILASLSVVGIIVIGSVINENTDEPLQNNIFSLQNKGVVVPTSEDLNFAEIN